MKDELPSTSVEKKLPFTIESQSDFTMNLEASFGSVCGSAVAFNTANKTG
jgi:hypothetical protein